MSTRARVEQFRISGIAKFGTVDSLGGATLAVFDIPTAQRLLGKEGQFDSISVAAENGVSPAALAANVREILRHPLRSEPEPSRHRRARKTRRRS